MMLSERSESQRMTRTTATASRSVRSECYRTLMMLRQFDVASDAAERLSLSVMDHSRVVAAIVASAVDDSTCLTC